MALGEGSPACGWRPGQERWTAVSGVVTISWNSGRPPFDRLHQASGQAVVLNGGPIFLGRHSSEESRAAYVAAPPNGSPTDGGCPKRERRHDFRVGGQLPLQKHACRRWFAGKRRARQEESGVAPSSLHSGRLESAFKGIHPSAGPNLVRGCFDCRRAIVGTESPLFATPRVTLVFNVAAWVLFGCDAWESRLRAKRRRRCLPHGRKPTASRS